MPQNTLFTYFAGDDNQLANWNPTRWDPPDGIRIDRYWNGRSGRQEKDAAWANLTQVTSRWHGESLAFYFRSWFDQLRVNRDLPLGKPAPNLCAFDVLEVFLQPPFCKGYYELQVSPLGQYWDLYLSAPRVRGPDWAFEGEIESRVDEEQKLWWLTLVIPFRSLDGGRSRRPVVGDIWRLNLFRVAGESERREYLAWRPTYTPQPDFHRPSSFGKLLFLATPLE